MRSVELFAGAGGLALGISQAGFRHEAVVEWDADACATIRENKRRNLRFVAEWPLFEGDARNVDYSRLPREIDLLAGGPPCQPFSLGGKHKSIADDRNMFPEMARAIRELRPRAILVENVKGLLRSTFSRHFEYILLQMTYPGIVRLKSESWTDHLARLERGHTKGNRVGLRYNIIFGLFNTADYGIPQRRERIIMIGFRDDQQIDFSFPLPTHSQESLLFSQWITGEYWDRHGITKSRRPRPTRAIRSCIERLNNRLYPPQEEAWHTVRDALDGLPSPTDAGDHIKFLNHRLQRGARAYAGHNGSPLDLPAKALKAGDHGVPGGENMLREIDGSIRYFSVRESARLQCFPDDYVFCGSWTECMRQLGNAVPVTLGKIMAEAVRARLEPKRNIRGRG